MEYVAYKDRRPSPEPERSRDYTMAASHLGKQQGRERTLNYEAWVPLHPCGVLKVVMDAVGVESQRRETKYQCRIGFDLFLPRRFRRRGAFAVGLARRGVCVDDRLNLGDGGSVFTLDLVTHADQHERPG